MMKNIVKYIKGRKTYCTVIAILVVSVMKRYGFDIPTEAWGALAALGLGFLRAGVTKAGKTEG